MYNDFYDSAYYGAESINEAATFGTAMMGMFAGICIFSLILSLIYIISYWKIFVKANKPGWASIVPIYSNIVMIEIAKLPMWYIALFFVPIANIYAIFKINIEIAKKFGKETGFGIGMTLLAIIFIPLLAFSDNVYEDNKMETSKENNSFDATNVVNNNVNENNVNLNNQFNTIEPSIEVENIETQVNEVNPIPTAPIVESTVDISSSIEPSIPVEPVVEAQENVEPLNNIPQYEPTINNVAEDSQETITPTIENATVNEPVENIQVEVEPVSPVAENVVNAFNSTPIMETVNEPIQTETLETITSIAPEVETVVEQVSEPVINEPVTNVINNNTTLTDNKFCKNCGNELPNIVSICPNCGTDNE